MAIAGIVSLAWGDQPTLPKGVGRIDTTGRRADTSAMGVRKRGLDIKAGAAKLKADRAARVEAELVIDRWIGAWPRAATCCGPQPCAPR
jgi:hypothetical protein